MVVEHRPFRRDPPGGRAGAGRKIRQVHLLGRKARPAPAVKLIQKASRVIVGEGLPLGVHRLGRMPGVQDGHEAVGTGLHPYPQGPGSRQGLEKEGQGKDQGPPVHRSSS